MKNRRLKGWVQTTLEVVALLSLGFICSIAGFEISALPLIVLVVAILGLSLNVLDKYGR